MIWGSVERVAPRAFGRGLQGLLAVGGSARGATRSTGALPRFQPGEGSSHRIFSPSGSRKLITRPISGATRASARSFRIGGAPFHPRYATCSTAAGLLYGVSRRRRRKKRARQRPRQPGAVFRQRGIAVSLVVVGFASQLICTWMTPRKRPSLTDRTLLSAVRCS